jgi:hypothetical protein
MWGFLLEDKMNVHTLSDPPCGSVRPNCRYLAAPASEPRKLCLLHLAWCPDDHDPRPTWAGRSITEQRVFRTGG